MTASCPLCAGVAHTSWLTRNGYALERCSTCGLIYVSPMPSPEALAAHYSDPAYFAGEVEQGYRDYAAMHVALRPHFLRRLRSLEATHPARGRLLDFGCADGYFLQLAQARGWQVTGVELSADMARVAAQTLNAPVFTDPAALGAATFDALTLWEVIEHLPDPLPQLRALYARLRPGGTLMLSTPNTGHWQAQRRPDLWQSYRPPSHLLYLTAPTLTLLLDAAGFTEIEVQRTRPLPALPGWLDRLTQPLQTSLATGQGRAWALRLYAWRLIRLAAWTAHRLLRPRDDVYVTLEARATRPG